MTNTPLNQDALEAAGEAIASRNGFGYAQFSHKGDANAAVRAYLASLPVAPLELTNAEWQEFHAIPDQGYSHRAWVDARIAERIAVAHPEVLTNSKPNQNLVFVNSVEEVQAMPGESVLLDAEQNVLQLIRIDSPYPPRWYGTDQDEDEGLMHIEVKLPARVLYRPVVPGA
ncbi:hypothetical protein [Glutamicibacter arilaitensis]|uniref:hypothetical protein n=1 Tax=Glutamicibacter arilaitensis TaxID=256701 RepID=UPI00384CB54D